MPLLVKLHLPVGYLAILGGLGRLKVVQFFHFLGEVLIPFVKNFDPFAVLSGNSL